MIEAEHLTKRYGSTTAVDDLSFAIPAGRVTGFLGPNGAGKTTTMRMILGLDRPDGGRVTIAGRAYRDLPAPLTTVGSLLEANAVHGGRRARSHLKILALTNGLSVKRVDEVLAIVGLTDVARRRVKGFSLGMSQRLGVAAALLGDPAVLMFDEPVNGLDPEGIVWIRHMMRGFAAEGRTVLVSSHLMSEMALTADHLLVIGRGRMIADAGVKEIVDRSSAHSVLVRSCDDRALAAALSGAGARIEGAPGGGLTVTGVDAGTVGRVALAAGLALLELTPHRASLEQAFMELTHGAVQFAANPSDSYGPPPGYGAPPGAATLPPGAAGWGPPAWPNPAGRQ